MRQICDKNIYNYIKEITNNKKIDDKTYMLIAHLASMNSEDPSTKTGACIVSKENKIISIGWNEMPFPSDFPWDKEGNEEDTKYPYVVHAERMAIHNAIMDGKVNELNGASMYINLFPCNECMQQVVLYNLGALYYDSDKYHNMIFSEEARRIAKKFNDYRKDGFICKQINPDNELLEQYKKRLLKK